MMRNLCISVSVALVTSAIPLHAANGPHAGTDSPTIKVWTNDDLERLHRGGLISVVGQVDEKTPSSESAPQTDKATQNLEWYAQHAAKLRDELERRQAQLREYQDALEDARSLKETAGGINLIGEDFAITPEGDIEILQQRVIDAQARLDDLEDLARHNGIEPGTLRGQ
jgi:hypothetical protein